MNDPRSRSVDRITARLQPPPQCQEALGLLPRNVAGGGRPDVDQEVPASRDDVNERAD
jgi:hypothetical protein